MHTILVVDDDKGLLRILELVFRRANYEVLLAENAEEALQLVAQHYPDIILMDDMMPGMPGIEACRLIKQNPLTQSIPVVIYSAGPSVLDRKLLREVGASCSLRKPVEPRKIVETVQSLLAGV
jgi:pilus assembly protein CpaE